MARFISAIILVVTVTACALAQSRPRERQQDNAPAQRQDASADQMQAIASELRAIREQQAKAEQRASEQESQQGEGVYWPPIWSNWILAVFAGVAAVIAAMSLGAIRRQADANVIAANAADKGANAAAAALDASVEAHRLEQRAWLGVVRVDLIHFAHGDSMRFQARITNSGKTPAKKCRAWMRLRARVPERPFEFRVTGTEGSESTRSISVMQPGAEDQLPAVSEEIVDDQLWSALTGKHVLVDVYGRIDYEDVFGRQHWTTFACFYEHGRGVLAAPTHNDCD